MRAIQVCFTRRQDKLSYSASHAKKAYGKITASSQHLGPLQRCGQHKVIEHKAIQLITDHISQGLMLADSKTSKNVFVEEIIPDGNAEKSGKVQVGDILSRHAPCSYV